MSIVNHGFSPDLLDSISYDNLKKVYDKVQEISPMVPPASCPPLPVLCYAVRNIVKPTFLTQQIPDIFLLLANIEMLRLKVVDAVEDTLAGESGTQGYDNVQQRSRKLTTGQLSVLQTLFYSKDEIREGFREIVNALATLDIRTILQSSLTTQGTQGREVERHLTLYFSQVLRAPRPDPLDEFDRACFYHFGQSLAEDETSALFEAGRKTVELVIEFTEFVTNPQAFFKNRGLASKDVTLEATFEVCFPPRYPLDSLSELIEWYLTEVTRTVTALSEVLSTST